MTRDMSYRTSLQWDSLADSAIKFCSDAAAPPMQWIYVVDDAWFHPQGLNVPHAKSDVKNSNGRNTFNEPIFTPAEITFSSWNTGKRTLSNDGDSGSKGQPESDEQQSDLDSSGGGAKKPFADKEIAILLGDLATQRGYGICFCSFEYFWTHYKDEINQPYHAVFFDINHALRGLPQCGDLDEMWRHKLRTTGLYSDRTINVPGLHGWLLHYAMKLGCEPLPRTKIAPSHILLISSNFAQGLEGGSSPPQPEKKPDPQPEKNPASQFGTVTLDIWTKLFDPGNQRSLEGLDPDARMADFGFSPFQKVARSLDSRAEMLKKGFEFFDRTFSKAASWEDLRQRLLKDMLYLWDEHVMGHDAAQADKAKLRGIEWIDATDRDETLVGTHHFATDARPLKITAKSLLAFLRQALRLPHLTLPADTADWRLIYPTSPGVAYLIGIADFYHTMCVPKNGRRKPNVTIVMDTVNGGSLIAVRFHIPTNDVVRLRDISTKEDRIGEPKSGGAVQRLKRKARVLLHYLAPADLQGRQYHNPGCRKSGCSCRNCREVLECGFCGDQGMVTFSSGVDGPNGFVSIGFNKTN